MARPAANMAQANPRRIKRMETWASTSRNRFNAPRMPGIRNQNASQTTRKKVLRGRLFPPHGARNPDCCADFRDSEIGSRTDFSNRVVRNVSAKRVSTAHFGRESGVRKVSRDAVDWSACRAIDTSQLMGKKKRAGIPARRNASSIPADQSSSFSTSSA